MSNKRPLSPESNNGLNNDNTRSLKRLKLHSIIQELRNEEANLAILKKLRLCQQLAARTNNTSTNGFHSTATRVPTNKTTLSIPPSRSSLQQQQQQQQPPPPPLPIPTMPVATRKPSNSINPSLITKIPTAIPTKAPNSSTLYSLEERKTQAKKALRNQLERDLLNIPSPKPLLQDILFIPNPTSLEFQPYVGFEDVVQCLYELQNDRHRLPQRFTDRAQIDEPYICDHCGTDFTIRWWKHLNTNNSLNQQINILCDRCKKQVTRRTLKSDHSALLKNVFVSAMEQEKEIEKTFHTLIKQQQKTTSRPSSSSSSSKTIPNNRPMPSPIPSQIQSMTSIPSYNHQKPKTKSSLPQAQNFATKLSQQSALPVTAARKSNVIVQPQINSTNNIRSIQHHKSPMPAHHHLPQQYRSATALPQHHSKTNQMGKMPKTAIRQQPLVSSRPLYPPQGVIIPTSSIHPQISSSSSNNARPTATKRRTLPSVNMK